MRIEVSKRDLQAAVEAVSPACAGGTDDSTLAGHYVFRCRDEGIQVLATDMARLHAQVGLNAATYEANDGEAMSVPGHRLRSWLSSTSADKPVVLESSPGSVSVKLRDSKGKGKWVSLPLESYPWWDSSLASATCVEKINASVVAQNAKSCKSFISDQETQYADKVQLDIQNGEMTATDSASVVRVWSPTLGKSRFRIFYKDVNAFIAFLSAKTLDTVEVWENEKCNYLKRSDGAILGIMRWVHEFPTLDVERNAPPMAFFTVDRESLVEALKVLSTYALSTATGVVFGFSGGDLVLGVDSSSNSTEQDTEYVPVIEGEGLEKLSGTFRLARTHLQAILSANSAEEKITFNVFWSKKAGLVKVMRKFEGGEQMIVSFWQRK